MPSRSVEFQLVINGKPKTLTGLDVRVLLLKNSMTITQVADRIGCPRESLSRLLHGRAWYPKLAERVKRELGEILRERRAA